MEYGPSRHRQHSRSSPCGRDWHRPTESSTSSIIQNHPAAMGGRSLTGPPFFVAARKFVEVLQYGGKRILTRIPQTVKVSRSDERRVGNESVSTCSSRWSQYH